ncbi:unnamed protein product, partial [Rotaria magnacalcarata]
QQIDDNGHLIRLNYLYEQGPRCQFNQEFYQLWSSYFKNHSTLSEEKSSDSNNKTYSFFECSIGSIEIISSRTSLK